MTDVFRDARERVATIEVARRYGLEINRYGKAVCPFHAEDTPSLSFKNGRFKCFGYGASGDSIDFTSRYLGLDSMDALRQLNEDFHLGLPLDRPLTDADRKQAERRRELREIEKAFNEWRWQLANQLDRCCRVANMALIRQSDDFTDSAVKAIQWKDALEYWSDILQSGTMDDIMVLFRDRMGVAALCDEILKNTLTKSKTA